MAQSRLFEALLFVFLGGLLLVQNWNVYHATVADNCNMIVLSLSLLLLCGRPLRAHLSALHAAHPLAVPAELAGTWALLLAQLAGLAAWLFRTLVDGTRAPKLAGMLGVPIAAWAIWRVLFHRWVSQDAEPEETPDMGGEPRRVLRLLLWQIALIVEQSLVSGYVVGVLPPAFAGEYLFFDWLRCGAFSVSAALSTGAILAMWTLHIHLPRLHALWCVLGAWKRVGNAGEGPAGGRSQVGLEVWDSRKTYKQGSVVSYHGDIWEAVGLHESNLARPGSRGAAFLHFWLGANALRAFDVVIVMQVVIVLFHIASAVWKVHYVADLVVALLNYPVILVFLYWRRAAIQTLTDIC